MLKPAISPSLMCADIFRLKETIEAFEKAKIEYLHIDVMDGVFVPNYCLGTDYCRRLKQKTEIPLDIHLMVTEPEKKISAFEFGKDDIVSFHYEASNDIEKCIDIVKERDAIPFLAINPDAPVEVTKNYWDKIGGVLLMTVFPGFAGQKMVPGSLERINALRNLLDASGHEKLSIEVDGNVNYEKAPLMREAGADIFVVGTSSILGPGDIYENTQKMRSLLK